VTSVILIRLAPRFTAEVNEACPQAVAGKGRSLEPELGGGSLDDGRDVAGREAASATAGRIFAVGRPRAWHWFDTETLPGRRGRCGLIALV
jgi:hypothetical protein